MKIVLEVQASPTESNIWENPGPIFSIGRSASCELQFAGEIGQLVSGRHAQVELSTLGAMFERPELNEWHVREW